ncbi:MAG: hypothetical protein JSR26_12195 [Proteobacteria bacterium]|nr:hypothetical protein [Pseudomonadota bacterium]
MITNDAGTPGPGRFEINVAAAGAGVGKGWSWSMPDVDINYGLGERIQLSVHVPWEHASNPRGPLDSGIGAIEYAIRWRFLDRAHAGIDLAVQPHLLLPGSSAAIAKGLSPSGREFILPVQAVHRWARFSLGIELARHWVDRQRGAIQAGAFVAIDCARQWECLGEINSTHAFGGPTQTLLGLGARRAVSDQLKLMGAVEAQANGPARQRSRVVYAGIQWTP